MNFYNLKRTLMRKLYIYQMDNIFKMDKYDKNNETL